MPSNPRSRRHVLRFEGAIEGYTVNFLRSNFWRVQNSMEFEDCMQEAYCVFLRLVDRYGSVDTPQHFMGLYKRAWYNHFTDLSNLDTKRRVEVSESQLSDEGEETYIGLVERCAGDADCAGYLSLLLQQAPDDVRTVLSFFVAAPQEIVDSTFRAWRKAGRKKDGGNNMLCLVLGFPPGTDLLGKVVEYFKTT